MGSVISVCLSVCVVPLKQLGCLAGQIFLLFDLGDLYKN